MTNLLSKAFCPWPQSFLMEGPRLFEVNYRNSYRKGWSRKHNTQMTNLFVTFLSDQKRKTGSESEEAQWVHESFKMDTLTKLSTWSLLLAICSPTTCNGLLWGTSRPGRQTMAEVPICKQALLLYFLCRMVSILGPEFTQRFVSLCLPHSGKWESQ